MASTARQRPGFSGEISAPPQSFWRQVSTFLYRHPWLIMLLLLLPPILWLGVVYLGSLGAMMVNSFYIYNSFTSQVTPGFTLANDCTYYGLESDVITPELAIEGGFMKVPDGYGLGVTVDESKLKKYRVEE